jgi:RNA polymerase-binding transcription factor DksA
MGANYEENPWEGAMTEKKLDKYRRQLRAMATRLIGDANALEEHARTSTGGDAGGNLSNAPMHLADLGTEVYMQELNSTLLKNEEHIRDEVVAALRRLDDGAYGQCENCGKQIPEARLDILPYTRFCTSCAEALESGADINFNAGRPQDGVTQTIAPRDAATKRSGFGGSDDEIALTDLSEEDEGEPADIHAAGTPGGGTAVGGLAGTNTGQGDPADADLENAMGSGAFDVALEEDDRETSAYAGSAGGAVGGTPAGKRAVGGKRRGGLAPQPSRGESAAGP